MDAKEFLKQAKRANSRMKLYKEELARVKAEIITIKSVDYSAPSVQTSYKADISDLIARLEKVEKENLKAMIMLSNKTTEVLTAIKKVKDETLCLLLYYRYIRFYTWEQVAKKINKTTRVIHRNLHSKALKEIEKINKNTEK